MGWLSENGWKDDQLTKMREASLFEEDSYALRPFFISEIARFRDDYGMFDGFIDFPLASLVDSIVRREVKLLISFMPDVDESKLAALLNQFFQEVARTMSDAETDRLDLSSIQLICEMVFGGSVSEEAVAVLRHRVSAFALLEQDLSPDDRRFSHSEIQDFFLAQNYIQLIISGQSSKSLSRNIIGSDLLDTFYEITSRLSLNDYSRFYFAANLRLTEAPSVTQEGKNILALILATAERFREIDASPAFPGFTLDELCLRGELASCELVHGTISLLDARGCDFSAMRLNDVGITTLLADDATRTPATMPEPYNLQLVRSGRVDSIYDPKERGAWLEQHRPPAEGSIEVSEKWQLLLRIARVVNRQKWIRDVEDDLAGRLLQNPLWPSVREVLENRNLLLVRESVDASGPRSSFYRLLQADDFLSPKLSGVAAEVQRALSK